MPKQKLQVLDSAQALARVGDNGCFQFQMALSLITTFTSTGFIIYSLGYLEKLPLFFCGEGAQPCSQEEACLRNPHSYTTRYPLDKTNLIRKLSLQCATGSQIGLIGTIYFIGLTLGSLFLPPLADRYGRKKFILLSNLLHLVAVSGLLLAQSLAALYIFFFILGLKSPAAQHLSYVYIAEVVRKDKRALYSTLALLGDCSTVMALPFYYFYAPDYTPLFMFSIALVVLASVGILFCVPESPRFLLVSAQYVEAAHSLNKIASCNGRPLLDPANEVLARQFSESSSRLQSAPHQINTSLAVFSLCLFLMTFTSYLIVFGIKYLESDIYWVGGAVGIGEIVGTLVSGLLAACLGRRQTFILMAMVAAFAALLFVLERVYLRLDAYSTVFVLLAKAGNSAGFNVFYLLVAETYPTQMRGTAFGIINMVGRLGGLLAPLAMEWLPTGGVMMGLVAGANLVLVLLGVNVEETRGKALEDRLE